MHTQRILHTHRTEVIVLAMMKVRFMTRVRDMGLDEKVFILVGVGPLASAKTARWMRANVAGVHIPDAVIARLEGYLLQEL